MYIFITREIINNSNRIRMNELRQVLFIICKSDIIIECNQCSL